ncbi:hypothetical protein EYF80_012771 [Liparis tanakae]|uniref:Uncharacterized protein n=1 Tax=Liparis tanakae TaxID=230148 RepID=A0A4Z2IGV7_9TELE|nr:hypothetical protein EYF80_012771 [Liparis tanakae]
MEAERRSGRGISSAMASDPARSNGPDETSASCSSETPMGMKPPDSHKAASCSAADRLLSQLGPGRCPRASALGPLGLVFHVRHTEKGHVCHRGRRACSRGNGSEHRVQRGCSVQSAALFIITGTSQNTQRPDQRRWLSQTGPLGFTPRPDRYVSGGQIFSETVHQRVQFIADNSSLDFLSDLPKPCVEPELVGVILGALPVFHLGLKTPARGAGASGEH